MAGKKRAFTGFGVFLLFVLGLAIFFLLNVKTVVVKGVSMNPTFKSGQRLLVTKAYWLVGQIGKKDVVVLEDRTPENPDGYFIKRVAFLPGETVDWKLAPRAHKLSAGEFRVPEGHVYVLGDNLPASTDSRDLGPLPVDRIIGKVIILRP